jgi:RNA polymerase sigma factor (TIGR02999 family)
MSGPDPDVTVLLNLVVRGDREAERDLFPAVYRELRKVAGSLRSRLPSGQTLGVTAVVHEAYIRVVEKSPEGWASRAHFFHAAARSMRDILVEDARRKASLKRGGDHSIVKLDVEQLTFDAPSEEILALQEVLEKLEVKDAAGHTLLMLRFFAGLTMPEIAEVMQLSLATVERKWAFLRAWLARELKSSQPE